MSPTQRFRAKSPYGPWAPPLPRAVMDCGTRWLPLTFWIVPVVELPGGCAILIGVCAAIAAIPLIAVMLAAIFTGRLKPALSLHQNSAAGIRRALCRPPVREVALFYIAAVAHGFMAATGKMFGGFTYLRRKPGFHLR